MHVGGRDPRERLVQDINQAISKQNQSIQAQDAKIAAVVQGLQHVRGHSMQQRGDTSGSEALRAQETHYATTIMLLAYGGFFALWASTAGNMPKAWFGASGLLMGFSLVLFIGFELAKTMATSLALQKGLRPAKDGRSLTDSEIIHLANQNLAKVNGYWPSVFLPTVLTGLTAGLIVLWFFGANALRGEWNYPPKATEKTSHVAAAARVFEAPLQKTNAAKPLESKKSARN